MLMKQNKFSKYYLGIFCLKNAPLCFNCDLWSVKGEKNPQKSHSLFDKEKLVVEQDRKNVTRLIDLPKKKKKSKKGAKQQEEETIQSHF